MNRSLVQLGVCGPRSRKTHRWTACRCVRPDSALSGERRGCEAEVGVEDRGDGEGDFVVEGAGGNLDGDGEAFGGAAYGDDGGGGSEGVEPLGVANGVEVSDGLIVDDPFAFAMFPGGGAGDGTKENRMVAHFFEGLG